MTTENRRSNISEELARAESALAASSLLFEGGFTAEAISRLYYALLYHVRSLLLTLGLEPKSHEGALRLLSLHFVKPGLLKPSAAHLFSRLMKFREEADYNAAYVFTKDDYRRLRAETETVAGAMAAAIKAAGFGD